MNLQIRLIALFVLPFATLGCASSWLGPVPRDFVIERNWVRDTAHKENLGFRRMNRMSPLILEQLVIQGNALDSLIAYDRKGGHEVWRLALENGVEGGVVHDKGRLYFGSSDGQFYCVEVVTGRVLWNVSARAETLAEAFVKDDVVYFQSGTDVVYALEARSGKQLWVYNRQTTANLTIRATSRPTVDGDFVYVGFSDGFLVSLRKSDGVMVWEKKLSLSNRFKDIDTTPVIEKDVIFAGSFDGSMYALNKISGETIWSIDEGSYTAVTLDGEKLYYATTAGRILAVEKKTGRVLWAQKAQRGIATRPTAYKGYLLWGESAGSFVVANAETGEVQKQYSPGYGVVSQPAVVPETGEVFFISNGANLFALHMVYKSRADKWPWDKNL